MTRLASIACAIGVLAASSSVGAQPAPPTPTGQTISGQIISGQIISGQIISGKLITRAQATALAQDTVAACAVRKETVAVYVTDAEGYMRVAMSSDDSSPIGLSSVTRKTAAVLAFKQPTRALGARLESDAAFRDGPGKDPRYFFHAGALPLYRAGVFVGVLAAGGGHDKDEDCALEALSHQQDLSVHP